MSRIVIWIANGLLFVGCCYLVAATINQVAAEALAPASGPARVTETAPPARAAARRDRATVILGRNLFNVSTVVSASPAPVGDDEKLDATKLPLKLLGTAASSVPMRSWAAVEDLQQRKHQVVRLNDKLQDKATVVAIQRRRIVLEQSGRREELALEEEPTPSGPAPVARRPEGNSTRSIADLGSRVRRLAQNRFEVSRNDLDLAGRNPAALFSQARILPKYEGGQMIGVQLNNVKQGSLFEQVGIRSGDIITSFNGIAINSPQESAQVLREFSTAPTFELVVRGADGSERTLTYEVQE